MELASDGDDDGAINIARSGGRIGTGIGGMALGAFGIGFGACEGEERRHIVCWNELSKSEGL